MNMSAACSALDALDRRMVQVTPLGIQGEGCRLGEKTHRVLDRRPGADKPSPSGGAASVSSPLRYGAKKKLSERPPGQATFTSTSTPRLCKRRMRCWVTRCLSRSARYRPPRSW